jgi:hypothetical protein
MGTRRIYAGERWIEVPDDTTREEIMRQAGVQPENRALVVHEPGRDGRIVPVGAKVHVTGNETFEDIPFAEYGK